MLNTKDYKTLMRDGWANEQCRRFQWTTRLEESISEQWLTTTLFFSRKSIEYMTYCIVFFHTHSPADKQFCDEGKWKYANTALNQSQIYMRERGRERERERERLLWVSSPPTKMCWALIYHPFNNVHYHNTNIIQPYNIQEREQTI